MIRLLLSADGYSISRTRIDEALTPPTLRGFPGEDGARMESETIQVGRSAGIISEKSGNLVLNPDVAKAIGKDSSQARLRNAVRRAFLTNVAQDEARTSNAGAADLARAAAWYLLQDPLDPPQRWDGEGGVQELRQRQLRFEDPVLENDTRWGALDRWMPFLGLAVHDQRDIAGRASLQLLVPDPTVAVRDELKQILGPNTTQQPLKDVLGQLGRACPVLDGGVYQRAVREMVLPDSLPNAEGVVSRSLSHSLLRLQQSGEVILLDRADAEKVLLNTIGEPTAYSHIERGVA